MNAELVSEFEAPRQRSWQARAVSAIGPITVLAATAWAVAQPYRLTFLHPHDQTFWWLVVEPPLLVLAVGLLFHFFVVPGVLEDLEAVTLPAAHGGAWPAITQRAAASSVASISADMDAPCVLASLGARDPGIHQHDRKGHRDAAAL